MEDHLQMIPSGATNSRLLDQVKQPQENMFNMNNQEKPPSSRYLSHSIDQIVESIPRNTPTQPTQHSVTNLIYQPHNHKDNSTATVNEVHVPVNYCTETVKPSSLPPLSFPFVNTLDRQYYSREIQGGASFEPLLNFPTPYSPLALNTTKDYIGMKKVKYTSLDADASITSIGYKDTGLTMLSNLAHSRSPISDSGEEKSSDRGHDDGIVESRTSVDLGTVSDLGSAVEPSTVQVTSNEIVLNFTSGHDVIVEDRRVLDVSNSDLMFYGEGQESLGSFEKHDKGNEEYKIVHIVSSTPLENSENSILGNSQITEDKTKSLCIELSTSDQDFNLCAEDKQVEKFIYSCGACDLVFGTLCNLHFHLESHGSDGSYFFDRSTWTAYPRFDVVDNGIQVYPDDIEREFLVDASMDDAPSQTDETVSSSHILIVGEIKENLGLDQIKDKKDQEKHAFDGPTETNIIVNESCSSDGPIEADINVNEGCSSVQEAEVDIDDKDTDVDYLPPQKQDNFPPKRQANKRNKARLSGQKSKDGLYCNANDMTITSPEMNISDKLAESQKKSTENKIPDKFIKQKATVKKVKSKADTLVKKSKKATSSAQKQENIQCSDCEKCFNLSVQLKRHKERVHGVQKTYRCKTCSAEFISKDELITHRQDHKTQIHKCDICEKVVTTAASLRDHLNYHMGVKPHKCSTCGQQFRTTGQLNTHVREKHDASFYQQCEVCGKTFTSRYRMREHTKQCQGIKPHKCEFCDKRFIRTSQLNVHRRTHTGEKPYVCDICGCALTNYSSLIKHKRIHTGEKPYKCDQCSQVFTAKTTLNDHQRIHTQEKRFQCQYCERSFIKKWNLKTHLRQHTGETPYKCKICGQGYKQNVLLKTHMQTHNSNLPIPEPAVEVQVEDTWNFAQGNSS